MDGMVRASLSERCQQEVADLEKCTQFFFNERQAQQGLQEFLVNVRARLKLIPLFDSEKVSEFTNFSLRI